MSINCPVCDRHEVSEMICPNCGTDLSSYQMLANLPLQSEKSISKGGFSWWLALAVLWLIFGCGLGVVGKSIVTRQVTENPPYTKIISSVEEAKLSDFSSLARIDSYQEANDSSLSQSCNGFTYVVRQGDSLSLIANRFYGDFNYLSWIRDANLQLKGREGYIKIGEQILIPNLEC